MAEGHITVVPEVLVAGGGGAIEGLAATLMRTLGTNGHQAAPDGQPTAVPPVPAEVVRPAPTPAEPAPAEPAS